MIVDNQQLPLTLSDQFYLSASGLPHAGAVFKAWYTQQAFQVISERVQWFAAQNGFDYGRVKITEARTRWGSCGRGGSLNFSWRLVMAPLPVIDYVVVHELVHLQEKNHSKAFWMKVKLLMPDYQRHINWLNANGYLLTI